MRKLWSLQKSTIGPDGRISAIGRRTWQQISIVPKRAWQSELGVLVELAIRWFSGVLFGYGCRLLFSGI